MTNLFLFSIMHRSDGYEPYYHDELTSGRLINLHLSYYSSKFRDTIEDDPKTLHAYAKREEMNKQGRAECGERGGVVVPVASSARALGACPYCVISLWFYYSFYNGIWL